MPGINSSASRHESWEMEHDRYQHYFYDDHHLDEDFYKSTAPSEDIWKKFELVPTPPVSPSKTPEGAGCMPCPSPGDRLEWVSQFLGQDEEQEGEYKIDTEEIFGNLSSIIIQDCMWNGFSASRHLEKVVSERLAGSVQTKLPLTVQTGANPSGRAPCAPHDAAAGPHGLVTDCVDPAAVLTFPIGNCKKQASSGTESRTDSSDEEEIDVVTVESQQNKGRLVGGRKPVTITVRADPHDPCMKRFHISIHQQQHNYAAPSPDSPAEPEPSRKRVRQEASQQHLQAHSPSASLEKSPGGRVAAAATPSSPPHQCIKSQPSSPQSSDCEDSDRRRTHNYLERKRRNDLRSRFLALRDQIPGLADCPKTPKVVILTKAREYLRLLHASERHQAQEKKQLRSRQQQLLKKLADLKRP